MHMKRTARSTVQGDNYRWSVLGAGRRARCRFAAAIGGNVRGGPGKTASGIGAGKLAASNCRSGDAGFERLSKGLGLDVATADRGGARFWNSKGGDKGRVLTPHRLKRLMRRP